MTINANARILLFSLILIWGPALQAQNNKTIITGKVVEANQQQPVEFVTILLTDARTKKALTGTTTAEDGTFEIETTAKEFYLDLSFIGFNAKTISDFPAATGKIDLGTILLSENQQTLQEVEVRAEKSQTEFKLDKRVFNVGKDLSTTGASALEVLNNVPSVTVNIEGQISLRGSQGVQILINGKPSVLASEGGNALGTITADIIEKIEVITNPSAKYDAEGTTGIINIVIKKEDKRGLNGSVTLNTGTPNNHSIGLSFNRRTEKFNLFSQLGFGHRTFPSDDESIVRGGLESLSGTSSIGDSEKNETFYNVILGTDYHIDDLNVLSLSGHFGYEIESEFSDADFTFTDFNGTPVDGWQRKEATEATNPKWQYDLQYKREFKRDKKQVLLFSALGNFFGKDQSSDFDRIAQFGSISDGQQATRTDFAEATYTFKLDYTHPVSKEFIFETGAQYIITDVTNDFAVSDFVDNRWIENASLTNIFDFNQKVLGVYGTGAYEGEKWGLKVGLRLENTDLSTLLENTNESNKQQYTNLFPSAHTSYKVTDNFSVQAGYSRRIYRPRLWDLNPFFNIRNNFNIRTGNPNLRPQYTDSYEVNGIYIVGKTSFNLGVYHRYTTDIIERVVTVQDGVAITQPLNIGTNRTTGVELNAKYSPNNWFTVTGDFNFNYFNRLGTFEAVSFDFNADQWTSRMVTKFKLPAEIDLEISGHYESRVRTFQLVRSDNLFADIGIRKKVFKGKTVLNLSIRDIFASRVFESETFQPDLYLYSRRQRGRFITFGISYGFGKGEAMEFSGQKHF